MTEKLRDVSAFKARIEQLGDERNDLVRDYTGRMQAETLPSKVLKLTLKLSQLTFAIDREIFGLETEMIAAQRGKVLV